MKRLGGRSIFGVRDSDRAGRLGTVGTRICDDHELLTAVIGKVERCSLFPKWYRSGRIPDESFSGSRSHHLVEKEE